MAERLIRVCDRCEGAPETRSAAVESTTFEFEGRVYRVDVCADHGKELKKLVEQLESWTRSATTLSRRGAMSHRAAATGTGPADYTAIRAWAKEQGLEVAPKGRIADKIVSAYRDAFPSS